MPKYFKTFQEGDLVLHKIPFYKAGRVAKNFQLRRVSDNLLIPCVHISQLKKYYVPFSSEEREIVQTEPPRKGPPIPNRRAPAIASSRESDSSGFMGGGLGGGVFNPPPSPPPRAPSVRRARRREQGGGR